MRMGVVRIGEVAVAVAQPDVGVAMAVGLAGRVAGSVVMLVVGVMAMGMGMGKRRMLMLVHMVLRQVKPEAGQHQQARERELDRGRLPEGKHRRIAPMKGAEA